MGSEWQAGLSSGKRHQPTRIYSYRLYDAVPLMYNMYNMSFSWGHNRTIRKARKGPRSLPNRICWFQSCGLVTLPKIPDFASAEEMAVVHMPRSHGHSQFCSHCSHPRLCVCVASGPRNNVLLNVCLQQALRQNLFFMAVKADRSTLSELYSIAVKLEGSSL